jgi:hypothetical protein
VGVGLIPRNRYQREREIGVVTSAIPLLFRLPDIHLSGQEDPDSSISQPSDDQQRSTDIPIPVKTRDHCVIYPAPRLVTP